MSARLLISRDSGKDIGIRGLNLFLDREHLTNLSFGKTWESEIPAGEHLLLADNSLYKQQVSFSVQEGESIHFRVTNSMTKLGNLLINLGCAIYRVQIEQVP